MTPHDAPIILALYPFTRGFAFVLFQGKHSLIDWGIKEIRGTEKNSGTMQAIRRLIDRCAPSELVLEDVTGKASRRAERIRALHQSITGLAEVRGIPVACYSQSQVRSHFALTGQHTKQELAQAVARLFPALSAHLPQKRNCYDAEDRRHGLFAAAALAITHLSRSDDKR